MSRADWIISTRKGWFTWQYVIFRDGEPVMYGLALSERGARARAKNRRDRYISRGRTEQAKAAQRRAYIDSKTVV